MSNINLMNSILKIFSLKILNMKFFVLIKYIFIDKITKTALIKLIIK